MHQSSTPWFAIFGFAILGVLLAWADRAAVGGEATTSVDEAGQREFFESHVRPLLATHCYECHSAKAEKVKAGLRLDSRSAILEGGDSGPAMIPQDSAQSLLMSAVRYESFEMPPRGKLSDTEIATLERWIQQGAWWPPEETDVAARHGDQAFDWRTRKASHWAWQSPTATPLPDLPDCDSGVSPIDHFILARLRHAQLPPASPADPNHLVRRLYLDLIGLPPTAEQVQDFVADSSDAAYRRLVDQLLESPRFGEKWARHWLDLVRYAETCGHEFDYPIPHAYRYRDYLIRALNADVSYDQLLREHIAGDLISPPRYDPETQTNESILGTGFWFLGEAVHAPTDVRGDEADRVNNQIDVFGKAFLGMTLACARCHDHKFDPIPTTDYYALAGFLQSSRRQEALLDVRGRIEQQTAEIAARRSVGDQLLADSIVDKSWPALHDFAEYLLAAQERLGGDHDTGERRRDVVLDGERLDRFVAALQDDELQSAEHPMHAWRRLSAARDATTFNERRARLEIELRERQRSFQTAMGGMTTFADFCGGHYDDWFVTGWAFGNGPTIGAEWDGPETQPAFARPHVAHSGRGGHRQVGVLRSRTFTLEHEYVHYRMRGEDVQLRLIIDGYVMDVYNALLFADVTLESVNTNGRYRWVSQHRDLDHYLGHRAHLEIIDHGDGHAAVDGIYFSDAGPPPEPVHPLNLQLVGDASLSHLADLAGAYADRLQTSASKLASSDPEDLFELWNWLFKWQLVTPSESWPALADEVARLQDSLPAPLRATTMADGTGEDERVHIRGSHRNLGESVSRRLPLALAGQAELSIDQGSGRRQLAEQLTSRANPLVARVIVNRLWHHLMGRGIVATVDDFGAMGQPPTHPDLLDWLARDLMDHRWSLKHSIREIVLSEVYRQSSRPADPKATVADPDNRLWHRSLVKRLTAEAIRDSVLAISGRLDSTMFGPSVPVHLTPFMTGRGRPDSGPLDSAGRRSLYIRLQRNFLSPMMLTFDMPSPFSTMGRRSVSNVPAQSLMLMNDEFIWQQAEQWARRLLRETETRSSRIERLFLQSFARLPRDDERQAIARFLEHQSSLHGADTDAVRVWTDVCHAMWNAKEFLYVF